MKEQTKIVRSETCNKFKYYLYFRAQSQKGRLFSNLHLPSYSQEENMKGKTDKLIN